MSRTILLLSLRANPAFVQHLAAYAKGVSELGYSPAFLLDPAYKAYSNLEEIGPCLDSLDSALAAHPSHAIFLNPAMANVQAARRLKKAGARILYLYHEPWQMSRQYLQGEGFGASCRATLAHRFTIPLLRIADQVIVPSQFALSVYQASDVRFNPRVAYLPLLTTTMGLRTFSLSCRRKNTSATSASPAAPMPLINSSRPCERPSSASSTSHF
jgi:hypothetical protein